MLKFLWFWWECVQTGWSLGSNFVGILQTGLTLVIGFILVRRKFKGEIVWEGTAMKVLGALLLISFIVSTLFVAPFLKIEEKRARLDELEARRISVRITQWTGATAMEDRSKSIGFLWVSIINLGEPTTLRVSYIRRENNGEVENAEPVLVAKELRMWMPESTAPITLNYHDSLFTKLKTKLDKDAVVEGHVAVRFPSLDREKKSDLTSGSLSIGITDLRGRIYSDRFLIPTNTDRSPRSFRIPQDYSP